MDLYALPDGRTVTIRPIRPDDGDRLRRSHARLSDESRYRRFMSSKPQLTAADARYLVDIDGSDHYALVATVAGPEGDAIVGVARFIRLAGRPRAAEFAVVVNDAWQRQGLAGELMGRLADAAVARGIDRFCATILADNVGIRRVVERLAAGPVQRARHGSVLEVDFALPTRAGLGPPDPVPAMIAACPGG